jgi:hypothetical protein
MESLSIENPKLGRNFFSENFRGKRVFWHFFAFCLVFLRFHSIPVARIGPKPTPGAGGTLFSRFTRLDFAPYFSGFLGDFAPPTEAQTNFCRYLRHFWAAAWRPPQKKRRFHYIYIYIYIKNGSSRPKICVSSSRQTARKPFFFSSPCQIYVSERGQM